MSLFGVCGVLALAQACTGSIVDPGLDPTEVPGRGAGGGQGTGGGSGGVGGGQSPGYSCDPSAMQTVTLDSAVAFFGARIQPLLVDPERGCTSCHDEHSPRLFKVLPQAPNTFAAAFASGLLGDAPGGVLARLRQSDPATRMPLGKSAWSAADLDAMAELACQVTALSAPACAADEVVPGEAPMRRLTRREYDNALADLLGITTHSAMNTFPQELHAEGWFDNEAELLRVDDILANGYLKVAEDVTATATANLTGLLQCTGAVSDACARTFLEDVFARRAFRRPLSASEKLRLDTLFTAARAKWTLREAVELVMQAVLQSPLFLYRLEQAGAAVSSRPDSYEMAARLSFLYLESIPDAPLQALADQGQLVDPAVIKAQAQRLSQSPRARAVVANFHRQWLGLDAILDAPKDATLFPQWTASLPAQLQQETVTFVDDLFWNTPATASELVTARYSFMNKAVADLYGISGPAGAAFEKVALPANRAGVLGQATFLAAQALADQTHPVYRGNFVLTRLLGQELGAPPTTDPSGKPIDLPKVDPTKTTRERFAEHSSNPVCAACHRQIDPIGFALENYDAVGAWRSTEAGKPVDASATLVAPAGVAGAVAGPVELMEKIGQSPEFHRAVVRRWFAFAVGRRPTPQDACTLGRLDAAFASSGYSMRSLFVELSAADAFLYRGTTPGGSP